MQHNYAYPRNATRVLYRTAYNVVWSLVFVATLSGCGNVVYAYRAHHATAKLEEAHKAGAEHRATYEYTLAQEHLRKAKTEAAEADYGDACELAALADEYAQRALDQVRARGLELPPPTEGASDENGAENESFTINVGAPK
jgi:hypothetical protein